MEKLLNCRARNRVRLFTHDCPSGLLASLCGIAERSRAGISAGRNLAVSVDDGFPRPFYRGAGVPCTDAPELRAFCVWPSRLGCRAGRKVRFRFQCCDIRRTCRTGRGVGLERLAPPPQRGRMSDLRSRLFIKQFLRLFKRRLHHDSKRKIEVFSAGCPACAETIELVNRIACPSCEISVLDMNQGAVAQRAKELGIRSVPAVVIDDKLADCCAGRGPQEAALRAAGLGQPA